MDENFLRQMFGLQPVPMFNPDEYVYSKVDVRSMYDRIESDYKINVFREMLVSFSQKGE